MTVACLIKVSHAEADSYGAVGQKVSRLTGPWKVKKLLLFFLSLATFQLSALISVSSLSVSLSSEASLDLRTLVMESGISSILKSRSSDLPTCEIQFIHSFFHFLLSAGGYPPCLRSKEGLYTAQIVSFLQIRIYIKTVCTHIQRITRFQFPLHACLDCGSKSGYPWRVT